MDEPMPKTAKVTISLPEELLAKVDAAGRREHRTRSELIREALRHYLGLTRVPAAEPTPEERSAAWKAIREAQQSVRYIGPEPRPGPEEEEQMIFDEVAAARRDRRG